MYKLTLHIILYLWTYMSNVGMMFKHVIYSMYLFNHKGPIGNAGKSIIIFTLKN